MVLTTCMIWSWPLTMLIRNIYQLQNLFNVQLRLTHSVFFQKLRLSQAINPLQHCNKAIGPKATVSLNMGAARCTLEYTLLCFSSEFRANVRGVMEERPPSNRRWSPRAICPSIRLVSMVQWDSYSESGLKENSSAEEMAFRMGHGTS